MTGKSKTYNRNYNEYIARISPRSHELRSIFRSFWVGGVICFLGQCLLMTGTGPLMLSREDAAAFTSIVLVFLASLLTGIGVYDRIGKYAGGGSIVPITGFANSIVASAMEYRREGLVMGVGARLFQIAGPVLVYGIGSSVIVGVIAWLVEVL